MHMMSDQCGIDIQKSTPDILGKIEVRLPIAAVEIIKKYAADAARFVPMRQEEIFVAPFLKARVIVGVMVVTGFFQSAVKHRAIHIIGDHRREICAAAEPT